MQVKWLISFAVAQGDIINPHPHFYHTPEELGFPPVSRDGLPECDEYAPNYEPPCTVAGTRLNTIARVYLTEHSRPDRSCQVDEPGFRSESRVDIFERGI
jgi:hypothetical protein